jgi:opacity protein-like surface antigen
VLRNLDASGAELGGVISIIINSPTALGVILKQPRTFGSVIQMERNFHTRSTGDFDITTSSKTQLVTIGPRIGYAFCKWLPYVTGGLAIGDLDLFQQIRNHTYFFEPEGGSQTETNVGWMVGAGLEYAITAHWSARVQYQYIDLGDINFDHRSGGGFGNFIGNSEASLREHNASFAIIYKF